MVCVCVWMFELKCSVLEVQLMWWSSLLCWIVSEYSLEEPLKMTYLKRKLWGTLRKLETKTNFASKIWTSTSKSFLDKPIYFDVNDNQVYAHYLPFNVYIKLKGVRHDLGKECKLNSVMWYFGGYSCTKI